MDLSTEYLGITLPHPLVAGASPLADDLDGVKRLEDSGASAIVLRSLFEEQIRREQMSEYFNFNRFYQPDIDPEELTASRTPMATSRPLNGRASFRRLSSRMASSAICSCGKGLRTWIPRRIAARHP